MKTSERDHIENAEDCVRVNRPGEDEDDCEASDEDCLAEEEDRILEKAKSIASRRRVRLRIELAFQDLAELMRNQVPAHSLRQIGFQCLNAAKKVFLAIIC
jgi:hypothetical protein